MGEGNDMAGAMDGTFLDDVAYAEAAELARLQGGSVESCVARAVRAALEAERERSRETGPHRPVQTRAERNERARAWLAHWHGLLSDPPPASDHSWLYDDETGLPV